MISSFSLVPEEQPIKRLGQASEVASLIVYLLGSESEFISGSALSIDGGWH